MASFLDRFPPEIFFMIFEYLWAHEILSSFHNISTYLNGILSNYNRYLVNLESIRKSHFDLIGRCIRPEQVIVLTLSDENDTPNQSQLFQSCFSIKQFVHLHALKFIDLDDDGKSFYPDLLKLKELVSFEIDVKLILPLIRIPSSVERLIINIQPEVIYDIDPFISMIEYERLRYLSLCNCSCDLLQEIFSRAVRLTSLKLSLGLSTEEEVRTFINFHGQQSRIPPLISLSLSIDFRCE